MKAVLCLITITLIFDEAARVLYFIFLAIFLSLSRVVQEIFPKYHMMEIRFQQICLANIQHMKLLMRRTDLEQQLVLRLSSEYHQLCQSHFCHAQVCRKFV